MVTTIIMRGFIATVMLKYAQMQTVIQFLLSDTRGFSKHNLR